MVQEVLQVRTRPISDTQTASDCQDGLPDTLLSSTIKATSHLGCPTCKYRTSVGETFVLYLRGNVHALMSDTQLEKWLVVGFDFDTRGLCHTSRFPREAKASSGCLVLIWSSFFDPTRPIIRSLIPGVVFAFLYTTSHGKLRHVASNLNGREVTVGTDGGTLIALAFSETIRIIAIVLACISPQYEFAKPRLGSYYCVEVIHHSDVSILSHASEWVNKPADLWKKSLEWGDPTGHVTRVSGNGDQMERNDINMPSFMLYPEAGGKVKAKNLVKRLDFASPTSCGDRCGQPNERNEEGGVDSYRVKEQFVGGCG
ncbi:hypothetical protein OG21DRAFT_1521523 [Imleria badia]|nr:hypothetical protein OG21DRAFT_1521523 [Imleria badia]